MAGSKTVRNKKIKQILKDGSFAEPIVEIFGSARFEKMHLGSTAVVEINHYSNMKSSIIDRKSRVNMKQDLEAGDTVENAGIEFLRQFSLD